MNSLDYDGTLSNTVAVAQALQAAGLNPQTARSKAHLLTTAAAVLSGDAERHAFFVPGRVEVLGKHTDYAGGRSMVIAAEQGFAMALAPRQHEQVTVHALDVDQQVTFPLGGDVVPRAGHWSNYPMTVARRLARNFPGSLRGAEIALVSDLPIAAGMSSSSAMVVSVFLALDAVNRFSDRPEYQENIKSASDLGGYLGTVENGLPFGSLRSESGVGTFGGSEDQTAVLCGRANQISQYSYCPVRFERAVPLPPTHEFAIGVSGIVASKTGNALAQYNAASRSATVLAELWRAKTARDEPHLAAVVESSTDAVGRLQEIVRTTPHDEFDADRLLARLEQFVVESREIIPRAGDALAAGDLGAFGAEVDRSQALVERLLGNQVPETIFLAAAARGLGATAASAFGAGFGGSVWALVEKSRMETFLADWKAAYEKEFPRRAAAARFFSTSAGPAALRVC